MIRVAALAAPLILGGCAAVFVHTDGHPVRVSFGLGAVHINRGENEAIAVRRLSLGAYEGCGAVGAGFQACDEFRMDARSCGIGLVEVHPLRIVQPTGPPPRRWAGKLAAGPGNLFAKIADQVRAECAREPQKEFPDEDSSISIDRGR